MQERLEILRKTRRFQWGELADHLGISRSMLDQIRKGTRAPGPKLARKIESSEVEVGIYIHSIPGRSRDRPEKQRESSESHESPTIGKTIDERFQSLETRLAIVESDVKEILNLMKGKHK